MKRFSERVTIIFKNIIHLIMPLFNYLLLLGFLLIFIGIALLIVQSVSGEKGETKIESGGVIFIGPFPIVFGSNKRITLWMLVFGVVILVLLLLFTLLASGVV